jgi:hypothetical protein
MWNKYFPNSSYELHAACDNDDGDDDNCSLVGIAIRMPFAVAHKSSELVFD